MKRLFLTTLLLSVATSVYASNILFADEVIALYHLDEGCHPDYVAANISEKCDDIRMITCRHTFGVWGGGVGAYDYQGAFGHILEGDIADRQDNITIDAWTNIYEAGGYGGGIYRFDFLFLNTTLTFEDGTQVGNSLSLSNFSNIWGFFRLSVGGNGYGYIDLPEDAEGFGMHHTMFTYDRMNLTVNIFYNGIKVKTGTLPETVRNKKIVAMSISNSTVARTGWSIDEICVRKGIAETDDFVPNSMPYVIVQ